MTDPIELAREHDLVEPLLAEHALGTTEPDDAARADRHLRDCAACRLAFAELADAVAGLEQHAAASSTLEPRAGDRAALLAAARQQPQRSTAEAPAPTRRQRRRPAPSWLGAAVASLACLLLVVMVVDRERRIDSLERRLDKAKGDQVAVLRGASINDLDVGGPFGDSRGQVALQGDAGIVAFRDVPAPPEGMVWQLWTIDSDDRIRSLGIIDAERRRAILPIEGVDPEEVERIIVTVEPAGGSDEPTAEEVAGATV
jgi:anti-sigma-K factor RskA